jgi:hypothetical protein
MRKYINFFILLNLFFCNLTILFAVGRTEVVGWTKTEQLCGVVYTYCRVDNIRHNIHVYWLWSDGNNNNRNQRYNFYDYLSHSWSWADSGIKVFSQRSGYGSMDYDPITGIMVASTQQAQSGGVVPIIVKDSSPGAGVFTQCQGPTYYQGPLVAVTNNQAIHLAMANYFDQDSLWYTRCQPWNTWSLPIRVPPPAPSPFFPCYNICASKVSDKVVITWEESEPVSGNQERGYYRLSDDGGVNWSSSTQVPFPPAFSGETLSSFHIAGLYPMFDINDNLHIVTQVHPAHDSAYYAWPTEIWHYSPINNPVWSRIARRGADTIGGIGWSVGYNALSACRTSLIQNVDNGYLYTAWEAFDSLNYEPLTGLLRADIWIAESRNNGLSWSRPMRVTNPNTTSKRYPCLGGIVDDSLVLAYMIDSIAGFENSAQGRATWNPIVVHRIKTPLGIKEEQSTQKIRNFALDVIPNPFSRQTMIHFSLPINSNANLEIYDISGKLVRTLFNIQCQASHIYSVNWDGKCENNIKLPYGVYFLNLKANKVNVIKKIILLP